MDGKPNTGVRNFIQFKCVTHLQYLFREKYNNFYYKTATNIQLITLELQSIVCLLKTHIFNANLNMLISTLLDNLFPF